MASVGPCIKNGKISLNMADKPKHVALLWISNYGALKQCTMLASLQHALEMHYETQGLARSGNVPTTSFHIPSSSLFTNHLTVMRSDSVVAQNTHLWINKTPSEGEPWALVGDLQGYSQTVFLLTAMEGNTVRRRIAWKLVQLTKWQVEPSLCSPRRGMGGVNL